jgi:hypothetical protein
MEFGDVKDSGERRDFGTGSVRDVRDGKGRYDLLPVRAIRRLARHFENGAKKYGDRNWEKGQPLSVYLDSALRHGFNVLEGKTDEDHAAAMAWNIMAFIETQERILEGSLPASLADVSLQAIKTSAPQDSTLEERNMELYGHEGTWDDPLPSTVTNLSQAYESAPPGSIGIGFEGSKYIKTDGDPWAGWFCCSTGHEIAERLGVDFHG